MNAQRRDDQAGTARAGEQRRLDPTLREREHERHDGDPGNEPGARLGQQDHERRREEEHGTGNPAEAVPERETSQSPRPSAASASSASAFQ